MESIYQWDRDDKLYAIEALHHSDDPARGEYLLQLIVDDDPVVRGKTALAMEDLDDTKLLQAVEALLDQDATEYKILACELLGSTDRTEFSDTIKPLLESNDVRVVRAAIAVLDNLPDETTRNLLESIADNYNEEWSKAIKRLLNRWHPPESFPIIRTLYPQAQPAFRAQLLRLAASTGHPDAPGWIDESLKNIDISDEKTSVIRWLS